MHKYAIAVMASIFLIVSASLAQSLGDVARQQRQKQQGKQTQKPRKVVTNEDIPERPDTAATAPSDDDKASASAPSALSGRNAEQWKSAIQAQKAKIASLQAQTDKLKSSVYFVEANRYYNGVQYNQSQTRKQQEAERMQKQVDAERKTLTDMQEAARRAGFGSAVYDP